MKWIVAAVGRPRLGYARAGIDDYLSRIERFAAIEFQPVRAGGDEGRVLLDRSEGCHRLVLDERGKSLTSVQFAKTIGDLELRGTHRAAILIGGADGHSEEVRKKADAVIALSAFTLQHELALLIALEQIYRAYGILRGTPYHRE